MAKRPVKDAKKADTDAAKDARLWKKELQLADKREKPWRDNAEKIVRRYRGEERKRNRYNVLWANTEILRPAIFNTKPNPDVRRRFRDADPLGKAVSEVLERSLYVHIDGYDTECASKNDVLDALLVGRGVSRIRYVANIAEIPKVVSVKEDDDTLDESVDEEIDYEQALREHVDWKDFRHGYGRVWDEVPWVGYRHKLTRIDAEKKFSKEVLRDIEFTQPSQEQDNNPGEPTNETTKVVEFWEIWDKAGKRVFFTQDNATTLLFPMDNQNGEPPLELPGFFPTPEPLNIVENTGSLIPIPHFQMYEEQANELDKISARIDKIVEMMKLRGIRDSKLTELEALMDAGDGQLVAVQNTGAWTEGGLDKAISWMPIEKCVAILEALYEAREKQKAIIDEITGISDIIRGVTDAHETYGAQQLKSNYASVRLQRMQREVQRYERDMLRLAAAVMADKFGADTFAKMTDLKFPTAQEKQQMQMQVQMAQQHQQPPPIDPKALQVPSWDEIIGLMHSPSMRQFRIDIETDSTIAAALDSDLKGITEVMSGISQVMTELTPLAQAKVMPPEAIKELVMGIIRRARLGSAVEDAFEKMEAPPPPPPPPPDPHIQVAQIKAQSDKDIEQMKLSAQQQITQMEHQTIANTEAAKANVDLQRVQHETAMRAQVDMAAKDHDAQVKQAEIDAENQRHMADLENQRVIADAANQTKLMIAQLQAEHQAQMTAQTQQHDQQMASQQQSHDQQMTTVKGAQQSEQQDKQLKHEKSTAEAPTAAAYKEVEGNIAPMMKELMTQLSKPRRIIRDGGGKMVEVH